MTFSILSSITTTHEGIYYMTHQRNNPDLWEKSKDIDVSLNPHILKRSSCFLKELKKSLRERGDSSLLISNNYKEYILDIQYYLVYNYFIRKGKKSIDKRMVREISGAEVLNWLDNEWILGDEPEIVLLPIDKQYSFGIYIQDSVYFKSLN